MSILPEGLQILEIKDVEKIVDSETKAFKSEIGVLRDFVSVVKGECVLNSYYFSFFDIPDLIVKKRYNRKDYELIIKMLNKVKKLYLVQKADIIRDRPI